MFPCCLLRVLVPFNSSKLLVHLRALNERVQDIENTVTTPHLRIVSQDLDLLVVLGLLGHPLAVSAEAVELVYELVDDIPRPVVLYSQHNQSLAPVCRSAFSTNPEITHGR